VTNADQINAAALAVCTERERVILHLRYHEEQTWDSIATALDLDRTTVIRSARRCLGRIRRHLDQESAA